MQQVTMVPSDTYDSSKCRFLRWPDGITRISREVLDQYEKGQVFYTSGNEFERTWWLDPLGTRSAAPEEFTPPTHENDTYERGGCCWGCLDGQDSRGHFACTRSVELLDAHQEGRIIDNHLDHNVWTATIRRRFSVAAYEHIAPHLGPVIVMKYGPELSKYWGIMAWAPPGIYGRGYGISLIGQPLCYFDKRDSAHEELAELVRVTHQARTLKIISRCEYTRIRAWFRRWFEYDHGVTRASTEDLPNAVDYEFWSRTVRNLTEQNRV